jgi:hypothetical protein
MFGIRPLDETVGDANKHNGQHDEAGNPKPGGDATGRR